MLRVLRCLNLLPCHLSRRIADMRLPKITTCRPSVIAARLDHLCRPVHILLLRDKSGMVLKSKEYFRVLMAFAFLFSFLCTSNICHLKLVQAGLEFGQKHSNIHKQTVSDGLWYSLRLEVMVPSWSLFKHEL